MIRLLEIGALYPDNYAGCSTWINNHPIDLKSNHPGVLEQDFFQRPLPRDPLDHFDVISCSLVLNFVSEPKDRGKSILLFCWLGSWSDRDRQNVGFDASTTPPDPYFALVFGPPPSLCRQFALPLCRTLARPYGCRWVRAGQGTLEEWR